MQLQDYDFANGRLTIQRALKTPSGVAAVEGPPKNDEHGSYALPDELRVWIQKHRGEA
jgi:hypothetical protein